MLDLVFRDASDAPPDVSGPSRAAWRDDLGTVFAQVGGSPEDGWLTWRDVGTFAFRSGRQQVDVWPESSRSAAWISDQFSRLIQPVILQVLGYHVLHASAADTPDGAVVFCGTSGAGKSTFAFALGRLPGCRQVADDAVVMDVDADRAVIVALPFFARLRDTAAAHYATSSHNAGPALDEPAARVPLRAIVLLEPHEHGHATALDRVNSTDAFRVLLPHAHCVHEDDRPTVTRLIHACAVLADRVDVFTLAYVPGLGDMDAHVTRLRRAIATPVTIR